MTERLPTFDFLAAAVSTRLSEGRLGLHTRAFPGVCPHTNVYRSFFLAVDSCDLGFFLGTHVDCGVEEGVLSHAYEMIHNPAPAHALAEWRMAWL